MTNKQKELGLALGGLLIAGLAITYIVYSKPTVSDQEKNANPVASDNYCTATAEQRQQLADKVSVTKNRYNDELFQKSKKVVGVGVGLSEQNRCALVIKVFLSEPLGTSEAKNFPNSFDGVPVETEVTGTFKAL